MSNQLNLLVAITLLFVTNSFSQRPNYDIENFIGLHGGISQFDIITDNFTTEKKNGFAFGLTGVVNVEHKWYDVSYGIQFSQNNVNVLGGITDADGSESLEYKLSSTQLAIFMHAKLLHQNFTIDFGPVVQANGFLELKDKEQEDYFVNGFEDLKAIDLRDISKFNINGAIGATAGLKHFSLRAQYQYGLTNMLRKLNDLDFDADFKGNQSQLILTAIVLF
ncbi:MAG: PorT family protein [Bacteroidia bacterium]|nr:PorT family protein [Bacteroidia bacterium]